MRQNRHFLFEWHSYFCTNHVQTIRRSNTEWCDRTCLSLFVIQKDKWIVRLLMSVECDARRDSCAYNLWSRRFCVQDFLWVCSRVSLPQSFSSSRWDFCVRLPFEQNRWESKTTSETNTKNFYIHHRLCTCFWVEINDSEKSVHWVNETRGDQPPPVTLTEILRHHYYTTSRSTLSKIRNHPDFVVDKQVVLFTSSSNKTALAVSSLIELVSRHIDNTKQHLGQITGQLSRQVDSWADRVRGKHQVSRSFISRDMHVTFIVCSFFVLIIIIQWEERRVTRRFMRCTCLCHDLTGFMISHFCSVWGTVMRTDSWGYTAYFTFESLLCLCCFIPSSCSNSHWLIDMPPSFSCQDLLLVLYLSSQSFSALFVCELSHEPCIHSLLHLYCLQDSVLLILRILVSLIQYTLFVYSIEFLRTVRDTKGHAWRECILSPRNLSLSPSSCVHSILHSKPKKRVEVLVISCRETYIACVLILHTQHTLTSHLFLFFSETSFWERHSQRQRLKRVSRLRSRRFEA